MKQIAGLVALVGAASVAAVSVPRLLTPPQGHTPGERVLIGMQCFAQGTSPEYIAKWGTGIYGEGEASPRFFAGNRWPGTFGTPVNLTYSFPPDGVSVNGSPNVLNATLNSQFGGNTALWKSKFAQAFAEWSAETGNTYTEVSDDGANWPTSVGNANRGDIRIVARNIDGGSGVLAQNFFPSSGGDMQLDSSENWGAIPGDYIFLRNVVSHEHGHGLGLAHSCPQNLSKLMEPTYTSAFVGPQVDDRRGAQYLYGDVREPNNTTGDATDLVALGFGVGSPTAFTNLSLHSFGDSDVFRFASSAGGTISVNVTPTGGTYLNGPQNGDGSCQPGTSFNSTAQQNIILEVLNSSGGVLTSVNVNAIGLGESISNFNLGSTGDYYIRVRSGGNAAGNETQLYNINFIQSLMGLAGDLNGDGCISSTDLGILLGSWGGSGTGDINGDGVINAADLAALLGAWGTGC